MLLYLRYNHPDISFVTHQCAWYTQSPRQVHEDVLIWIGHYLKGIINEGLILKLKPIKSFKIDCYPYANFAGLWTHDDKQAPHCVQSRTGYMIIMQTDLSSGKANSKGKLPCPQWRLNMLFSVLRLKSFPLIGLTKPSAPDVGHDVWKGSIASEQACTRQGHCHPEPI